MDTIVFTAKRGLFGSFISDVAGAARLTFTGMHLYLCMVHKGTFNMRYDPLCRTGPSK